MLPLDEEALLVQVATAVREFGTMSDDAEVTFPTEPPFGPILDGEPIIVYYHYRPNKPAAYLFLALFALSTLLHLFYLFRLRSWYFIPLILGGIGMQYQPMDPSSRSMMC